MLKTVYRFAQGSRSRYEMVVGFRKGAEFGEVLIASDERNAFYDSLLRENFPDSYWSYSELFYVRAGEELTMDVVTNDDTDWSLAADFPRWASDLHDKLVQEDKPTPKPLTASQETAGSEAEEEAEDTIAPNGPGFLSFEQSKKLFDCLGPQWKIENSSVSGGYDCVKVAWDYANDFSAVMSSSTGFCTRDEKQDVIEDVAKGIEEIGQFYLESARRLRSGEPWTIENDLDWIKDVWQGAMHP